MGKTFRHNPWDDDYNGRADYSRKARKKSKQNAQRRKEQKMKRVIKTEDWQEIIDDDEEY